MNRFTEKDREYFDYIVEHKRNILAAYNALCYAEGNVPDGEPPIVGLTPMDEDRLRRRVIAHDLSKFGELEFDAYRKKFFAEGGDEGDAITPYSFEKAWKAHYSENTHHPEYFIVGAMSKTEMVEMVLDWCAMSIKFGGCPHAYYVSKREELINKFGDRIDHDYVNRLLVHLSTPIASLSTLVDIARETK